MLSEKIAAEKWGAKVIEQIASDLQRELPGLKGFSYTNLKNMRQFFEAYNFIIGQLTTGQLDRSEPIEDQEIRKSLPHASIGSLLTARFLEAFFGISFTHHLLLLNKCKSFEERLFYTTQAATEFWSVTLLEYKIQSRLFQQQGQLPNNFDKRLPEQLKATALQVFQDEYLFDFISTEETEDERVFEGQVVANIKNTIMALGKGFSFIGNQYRLEIEGQEFFIDLLFYNRYLQCLVAFELKRGKFKPAYAGQLNFYLNVLDDRVKLPHENPSIGIILCKEKNNTVVEFAFKSIDKAMGAATYKTTKQVPKEMKGILPAADELANLL
jgi:predicted nuclease of restriction endonuclease-like (RecB) superfamily